MFPRGRMFSLTVIGKVFKPNKQKILALNRTLSEYFELVKWYLTLNSTSKSYLHQNGYEYAKGRFNLNTALIQTARDKAVEMLKSFERTKDEDSVLRLRRVSIRFDRRCYNFSKTTNVLTPYWLTLSLNKRQRIEDALKGEWSFSTVEMVKRNGEWYAHFILKKAVEVLNEPETIIAIDRGEVSLGRRTRLLSENDLRANFDDQKTFRASF